MPVVPLWRGLALRRGDGLPGNGLAGGGYYWAHVPVAQGPLAHGHVFDLAGWEPLPSGRGTEIWVLDLLDAAQASPELVIYADPARRVPLRQFFRGVPRCLPVPVAQLG